MKSFSGKDMQKIKEQKIEETLLSNYDKYYRLAYSYVHSEADAGDIVQNGAYRAIRNSHTLKQTEYVSTWIYRIMLNEIFRFCRSRKDVVSLSEVTIEEGKFDVYANIDLQNALDTLSSQDKAVIELRFFEDKRLDEIAEILNENISTVKSRLYRSMKKLRLELEG